MRSYHWMAFTIVATMILIARPAGAVDYRAEIITNVLDPCILSLVQGQRDAISLSDEEITTIAKIVTRGSVERMIRSALPTVEGKPESARRSLYSQYLERCIASNTAPPASPTASAACARFQAASSVSVSTLAAGGCPP